MPNLELRFEVRLFAEAMELALRAHDHDRGDGWKDDSAEDLFSHLLEEVTELHKALSHYLAATDFKTRPAPSVVRKLLKEGADVGNMTMMVVDACLALVPV